jgi:hypothetical protein
VEKPISAAALPKRPRSLSVSSVRVTMPAMASAVSTCNNRFAA